MKRLSFITVIISILLTVCCCSEERIEIKGKVSDLHTKAAIPYKKIVIHALVRSGNKEVPVYNGEFSTDSSGCFAYTLKKMQDVFLYDFCVIGDSAYASSNIKLGLTELKRYGKFLDLSCNKLADLTIRTDMNCSNSNNDVLYVTWESDGINGSSMYPYKVKNYGLTSANTGLKWTGGHIKSEIKTKVFANQETIVKWEIYSNDKITAVTDTILCRRDADNYLSFKY
ncbi:MAG: hypothetical protein JW915_10375 [Chitinispirillaceae bacterium]|nr:hypothetical protein [Chitinispirillaceae bacterium]